MEISGETKVSASSSFFARLSLDQNPQGQKVVVCKKSFFSWAVHAIRYRFSSNYREREHTLRESILESLRGQGSGTTATLNDPGDALLRNRRKFNAYLIAYIDNSDSAENSTAGSQGEIRVAEDGATSGNSQVQPAPAVKAKKIAGKEQNWSGAEGVESFWKERGPTIARDGYKNAFQFMSFGAAAPAECADVQDDKQLCEKFSDEIAETINQDVGGTVPSHVNCALAYILFTTPRGKHESFFSKNNLVIEKEYPDWGFLGGARVGTHAFCRQPNVRLSALVNGLLDRHFQAGRSKEQILKGLQGERDKAENPTDRNSFRNQYAPLYVGKISEAEFRFCLDAMENFANAYFDANS